MTITVIIAFIAGYLLGGWNEKARTNSIIYELSQLLKKNKIKTDITSIDLD